MAASNYLESGILTHIFRTGTFSKPATIAICLLSGVPNDTLGGNNLPELPNSNGYARQVLAPLDANWTLQAQSSDSGNVDNASTITFGPCTTADWAQVTHVALTDSGVYAAGNLLFWGALQTAKTVQVGDSLSFSANALDVYLS